MVTLAIASIVSAAAAATMAMVTRTMSSTRASVTVQNLLDRTVQFMVKDVENSGGMGLPPPSSILIENDCGARDGMPACGGSDRATLFTAVPDLPICATRIGSRAGAISLQYRQGGCCFPAEAGGHVLSGFAMLTATSGTTRTFRPVKIDGISGSTCEFDVVDVVPQALYLNAATQAAHEAVAVNDFTPFIDGDATIVQMRTYFLDPTTHELQMRNGISATNNLVSEDIFDFQVALGLDSSGDGVVTDSEWAWRGSDAPAVTSLLPRTAPAREVMVSLVQGLRLSIKPDTVESPLRPAAARTVTVPGFALAVGVVRASPLNTVVRVTP